MLTPTKRSGTLEGPFKDKDGRLFYRGKIRLQDGSRVRAPIPASKIYDKSAARNSLAFFQEQQDLHHVEYNRKMSKAAEAAKLTAGDPGESCDAWLKRYNAYQKSLGNTDAKTKRCPWRA